jgi:hypothetical protein
MTVYGPGLTLAQPTNTNVLPPPAGGGDHEPLAKDAPSSFDANLYADKKIVRYRGHANSFINQAGEKGLRARVAAASSGRLAQDIIPYVESHYSTRTSSTNAPAGLSMGAQRTLNIGLKHLDKFAWIGALFGGGSRPTSPIGGSKANLFWFLGRQGSTAFAGSAHNAARKRRPLWHRFRGDHPGRCGRTIYLISRMLFGITSKHEKALVADWALVASSPLCASMRLVLMSGFRIHTGRFPARRRHQSHATAVRVLQSGALPLSAAAIPTARLIS